ncbi:MAG: hypothetical protein ACFUZC_11420 [Chthoniobacteraceae bacterium]
MKSPFVLVLLMTAFATVVLAGSDNILKNIEFTQTSATGLPAEWLVFCPPVTDTNDTSIVRGTPDLFAIDPEMPFKGKASLRISSPTAVRVGLLQSKLPVSAGQIIRFSCWIKANAIRNSANEGAWVRLGFSNISDSSKQTTAYKQSKFLKSPTATFDWLYLEGEATVPKEADHVEFGMFLWCTEGTVWFANPRVEIINTKS